MRKLIIKLCLFNLSIFCSLNIIAQNSLPPAYEIKLDTIFQHDLSNNYWQALEDISGKLKIEDIINKPFKNGTTVKLDSTIETYWFRYRLKNITNTDIDIALDVTANQADFYVFQDNPKPKHFVSGFTYPWNEKDGFKSGNYIPLTIKAEQEVVIYERIFSSVGGVLNRFEIDFVNPEREMQNEFPALNASRTNHYYFIDLLTSFFMGFLFFAVLFNMFFFILVREKIYLYFALFALSVMFKYYLIIAYNNLQWDQLPVHVVIAFSFLSSLFIFFLYLFVQQFFKTKSKWWNRWLIAGMCISLIIPLKALFHIADTSIPISATISVINCIIFISVALPLIILLQFTRKKDIISRILLIDVYALILLYILVIIFIFNQQITLIYFIALNSLEIEIILFIILILCFSLTLISRYNDLRKENAQQALDKERLAKEKEIERSQLIEQQKTELEKTVEERTAELKHSLTELKSTQSQLIQTEKMASLGELTAGIAHEIQNPLNFVNNFSEVNKELLVEMKDEMNKGNIDDANAIANDLIENEEKINHHGKRADAIVKGMLQHSRSGSGVKESTNINALADEYLRLSYHGLRAKEKDFNATMKTNFETAVGKINIIPQDIGRVFLNLYNNAFYAVNEKRKTEAISYEPTVSVITKKSGNQISITVSDNGNGIPQKVIDKIFQPFFTTKPTGQGTGLGLSLSYDIIKAHGGELKVETKEGEYAEFIIQLPIST